MKKIFLLLCLFFGALPVYGMSKLAKKSLVGYCLYVTGQHALNHACDTLCLMRHVALSSQMIDNFMLQMNCCKEPTFSQTIKIRAAELCRDEGITSGMLCLKYIFRTLGYGGVTWLLAYLLYHDYA